MVNVCVYVCVCVGRWARSRGRWRRGGEEEEEEEEESAAAAAAAAAISSSAKSLSQRAPDDVKTTSFAT